MKLKYNIKPVENITKDLTGIRYITNATDERRTNIISGEHEIVFKKIPICQVKGCNNPAHDATGYNQKNAQGHLVDTKRTGYRKSSWVQKKYGVKDGFVCRQHHNEYVESRRKG